MKGVFDVIMIKRFTDYYQRDKDEDPKNAPEDILSIDAFPDVNCVFRHAAQAGVRKSRANSDRNRELESRKGSEDLLNNMRNRW